LHAAQQQVDTSREEVAALRNKVFVGELERGGVVVVLATFDKRGCVWCEIRGGGVFISPE
jgi:hypothetical protein